MARKLPLLKQEREDTCAIACLRMVLAARGTTVSEADLLQRARMVEGGVEIEELQRLAREFGLLATGRDANLPQIRELLRQGNDVIAYINRRVFDLAKLADLTPALRSRRIHAVVPIAVTRRHVRFHDPMSPAVVTKTVRRFEAAQRHFRSACLVISGQAG
jgi:ABC-type bacteriocin/lantibiotic exporter with double-glycine peptidase domain